MCMETKTGLVLQAGVYGWIQAPEVLKTAALELRQKNFDFCQ